MKIIIGILIAFMFIFALGTASLLGITSWLARQAEAQDYTPLDFLDEYDKFEVKVGMDRINGRYMTYHYEFAN